MKNFMVKRCFEGSGLEEGPAASDKPGRGSVEEDSRLGDAYL